MSSLGYICDICSPSRVSSRVIICLPFEGVLSGAYVGDGLIQMYVCLYIYILIRVRIYILI